MGLPIMVLEAKALLNMLRTLGDRIQGHRIDANIDSMVLLTGCPQFGKCKIP